MKRWKLKAMTNQQREAVERLRKGIRDILFATLYSQEEMNTDIVSVLALIKEQDEKTENITTNYKNLIADVSSIAKELGLEEDATIDEIYTAIRILKSKRINVIEQLDCIQKKDKQIDLMARAFKQDDVRTVEEIKQYFAGLVEKE